MPLFSLVAGTCYLAKGGLLDEEGNARAALARFAAGTILAETRTLKTRVLGGAGTLDAARVALG